MNTCFKSTAGKQIWARVEAWHRKERNKQTPSKKDSPFLVEELHHEIQQQPLTIDSKLSK
jgi:hypothetical protein